MLNQIILVGSVNDLPLCKEVGTRMLTTINVRCQRSFANSNGVYENDIIPVTIWKGVAEIATDKLSIGDIITIKGRLQTRNLENKDGKTFIAHEVIGEKISFVA